MSADIMTRVREIGRQLEVMKWGEGMSGVDDRFMDELRSLFEGSIFRIEEFRPLEGGKYRVVMGENQELVARWEYLAFGRNISFPSRNERIVIADHLKWSVETLLRKWWGFVYLEAGAFIVACPIRHSSWREVKSAHKPGRKCDEGCPLCEALERGDG